MSEPLVSIVIINWKTPDLLAKCLDSIKEVDQNFDSFEHLVVDNNSGDGSVEMLREKYPYVAVTANSDNLGFSKACNQVIPEAKGKYVLLLNPDAIITENAITNLVNFMEEHPDCATAGPKVLNADGTLQLACRRSFPSLEASFYRLTYLSRIFPNNPRLAKYNLTDADPDKTIEVDALSGSCMIVRKDVIDKIGLLDEDIFMFGEDIDWCWRMKEAGWKVFYTPLSVVYHIHGAASRKRPVGTTINLHKGMEVFYRKHLAKNYWPPVNLLVYGAIWCRAGIFILVNLLRGTFGRSKDLKPENTVRPQESPNQAGSKATATKSLDR